MKTNNYYLELREGDKVLKRIATTLASEYRDREHFELDRKVNQEVYFVASSEKEKIIN